MSLLDLLAGFAGLLALCGMVIVAAGAIAVQRFAARPSPPPLHRPAVTVLKPLYGDEPALEAALASVCDQRYPIFQIVFGVQDANDPALDIVARIQKRFPACDIAVVVNPALHGPNRKVSNLINMMQAVRHEILVFSDSDLHVSRDYLDSMVAALEPPDIGLVTTLCCGLPTSSGPAARLGAAAISYLFLPGVLLSRVLGREDCLGTTMALPRHVLARIGGLESVVQYLAEDNALGRRVQKLGLRIALANTVPMTAVPEAGLRSLWQHELRWARTIRTVEPGLSAASTIQFPLFWSALACGLSGGSAASALLFAACLSARAAAMLWIDRCLLGRWTRTGASLLWMIPLRDLISVSQILASFLGTRVIWRGQEMQLGRTRSAGLRRVESIANRSLEVP